MKNWYKIAQDMQANVQNTSTLNLKEVNDMIARYAEAQQLLQQILPAAKQIYNSTTLDDLKSGVNQIYDIALQAAESLKRAGMTQYDVSQITMAAIKGNTNILNGVLQNIEKSRNQNIDIQGQIQQTQSQLLNTNK